MHIGENGIQNLLVNIVLKIFKTFETWNKFSLLGNGLNKLKMSKWFTSYET